MSENALDVEFEPHKPIEPINDLRQAAHLMAEKGVLDDQVEADSEEQEAPQEEIHAEAQDESEVDEPVQVQAEAEEEAVETEVEDAAPKPTVPSKGEIELALERERLRNERQQAQFALQTFLQNIGEAKPPEAGLIDEDPMEYMRQDAKFRSDSQKRAEAESQLNQLQQQQYQDFLQQETAKLQTDLPQLYDGDKGSALRQEIAQFAMQNGYNAQQLEWATAHDIKMLYAAMSFEKLQAKTPAKKVELKEKPKVVKAQAAATPTDPKDEALKARKAAFKKSGHVNDFAALLSEGDFL